jgi:hypothetical protein
MYEITTRDASKRKKLLAGAVAAPLVGTLIPATISTILLFMTSSPPMAAVALFVGVIATVIGLLIGVAVMAALLHRRSTWTRQMRDRIAADGIKAEEIDWFVGELKPAEKRSLRALSSGDPLLADAYRETLASRLTATRIIRSSAKELQMAKRRLNALKISRSGKSTEFQQQMQQDINKIGDIGEEARVMLGEAESRLRMIEAAATRQGSMADSELALKKLSARSSALPLALEEAKMAAEIRAELEDKTTE